MTTKRTLTVTIITENAAFDGDELYMECGRILREIAERVEDGYTPTTFASVRDSNGNPVARFRLRDENYPD